MVWEGFDSVDLVMMVEHVFGVAIADRDAERIHTLGQLHEYIVSRVGATENGTGEGCVTARAFYTMRRILIGERGARRDILRPTTPTDALLPNDIQPRQSAWRELERALGTSLPPLAVSPRLITGLGIFSFATLGGSIAAAVWRTSSPILHLQLIALAFLGFFAAIFAPLAVVKLTRPYQSTVPMGYRTLGQLSAVLLRRDPNKRGQARVGWTVREVWQVVRSMTARNARVKARTLTAETRFVDLM